MNTGKTNVAIIANVMKLTLLKLKTIYLKLKLNHSQKLRILDSCQCLLTILFCEENFNYVVEVFASAQRVGEDSTFSKEIPPACFQGSSNKINTCKF